MDFPPQLQSLLGLMVFVAIAWALSENRKRFPVVTVIVGLGIQILLAALLLGVPLARDALLSLNVVVSAIQSATLKGSSFVFGYAGGGTAPFDVKDPSRLVIIAFQVLPIVIVMSALSALLWHWRILPLVVKGFAWALERSFNIGGALGLGCASNIFLGMIEAPLLIRPYLERLTRSEMFTLFTCGLANVAGTVLVLFATVLEPAVPGAIGHIIVASLLSLPASILLSKVMIPGDETTSADLGSQKQYRSSMDAVSTGAEDGMKLYLNIVAMLLVMISLVALANAMVGQISIDGTPLSFERILGWIFAPIVWLIGVPAADMWTAGSLMGTKTILNEFLAYLNLAALPEDSISERTKLLMVYAMCGFANLGSVAMMIGSLSALVPSRKDEIVELSLKSIIPGTLSTCMTAAIVGLLPS